MSNCIRHTDWNRDMNPIERCRWRLDALDLSVVAWRYPDPSRYLPPCFTIFSAKKEQGLLRYGENIRSMSEIHFSLWTQERWSRLLRIATNYVANYALDSIIYDINKLDGASLKKIMCGIKKMKNLENELEIITDKLSWLLSKLKNDQMRAELGRQFVRILCAVERVIDRALAFYDTERLEFCIRNGLNKQDFPFCCSDPLLSFFNVYENCRMNWSIVRNALTYLNFGYLMLEDFWMVDSLKTHRIFLWIAELPYLNDGKPIFTPEVGKIFWIMVTAYSYVSYCYGKRTEPIQDHASPEGYIEVNEVVPSQWEWIKAVRYFWRSLPYPYATKIELLRFDWITECEPLHVWYSHHVCEEVVHEYPSPRSLQQQCRVVIRMQLLKKDHDLVKLIDQLNVATVLKDYLKLKI